MKRALVSLLCCALVSLLCYGDTVSFSAKKLDKPFVAAHAAMFASIAFDGEVSRAGVGHGLCHEGNSMFAGPHGEFRAGRFYATNLSLGVAITGLDYLLRHRRNRALRALSYLGPGVEIAGHTSAATHWLKECW